MFWGSQAEDLEHTKMAEGQNSVGEPKDESENSNHEKVEPTSERGHLKGERGHSNGERGEPNGERGHPNGEREHPNGERRDSKGRLLPNPVLCCESLAIRATSQVDKNVN